MKKTFRATALFAVLSMAAISCQKENFNDVVGKIYR